MATVLQPVTITADHHVILHNISWETYERLLYEQQDSGSTRLTYDRGSLEIMILSLQHERLKHTLATLVEVIAEERNLDLEGAGSTTFRRADAARGFEADACFYLRHAAQMRAREEIDLAIDPAPELVIEIDITHPSLDKLPIFAAFGVTEVWRHDGSQLTIYALEGTAYREQPQSALLPGITPVQLTQLIENSRVSPRTAWIKQVRQAAALKGCTREL
jgi:Uma2 family endonuclease